MQCDDLLASSMDKAFVAIDGKKQLRIRVDARGTSVLPIVSHLGSKSYKEASGEWKMKLQRCSMFLTSNTI